METLMTKRIRKTGWRMAAGLVVLAVDPLGPHRRVELLIALDHLAEQGALANGDLHAAVQLRG